jgi:Pyruvate/2-oxoacid:ferredoxin oxidoreductase delta subunit
LTVTPPAGAPAGPFRPAAPVTVTARCAGCGACLLTCPQRAIRPLGGTLLVRADLCTGCLECLDVCPVDAIDEAPTGSGGAP